MMTERVSIVGSGVVGQATGHGFLRQGCNVSFVDVRPEVVEQLRAQGLTAYLPTEAAQLGDEPDVTILTVSTPTEKGAINLRYLQSAVVDLGQRLAAYQRYHLVVVRSTVVPGTTEEMVIPTLEQHSGKSVGIDFGVCMNPEYLREKTAIEDFTNPWIIIIGQYDQRSGDCLARLYGHYRCPLYRLSLRQAEIQKYVHNLFNAVKISFFNEMRLICLRAAIRADEVFPLVAKSCEGMWNPTYGIKDFGPFDGMCLPKDTQAFYDWAGTQGWNMPLLAATMAVNDSIRQVEAKVNMEQPAQIGKATAPVGIS